MNEMLTPFSPRNDYSFYSFSFIRTTFFGPRFNVFFKCSGSQVLLIMLDSSDLWFCLFSHVLKHLEVWKVTFKTLFLSQLKLSSFIRLGGIKDKVKNCKSGCCNNISVSICFFFLA